jgi:alpha-glucosidase (family GH31 glycosyl hydrolase)
MRTGADLSGVNSSTEPLWHTVSGELHDGGTTVDAAAPLDHIPVFVRAGAAVATALRSG